MVKFIFVLISSLLCEALFVSMHDNSTTEVASRSTPRVDGRHVLSVLVTGPYPDPEDDGWDSGISLIPAVRLAFNQINDRMDILQGYKLQAVEDDSGCAVKSKAAKSFLDKVYYSHKQIIGVIGPACSGSTLELAPVLSQSKVSLIQINPTSTSPELITIEANTTFTMISFLRIIDSFIALMKKNSWTRVAILYDSERSVFRTSRELFVKRVKLNMLASIKSHVVDNKELTALHELIRHRIRVVLLFMENVSIQKLLCLAFNMSMIYPKYQWIMAEKNIGDLETPVEFVREGVRYNCSKDTMANALNGTILSMYNLLQDNNTLLSSSNQTYKEYRERYCEEFRKHLNETRIQNLVQLSAKDPQDFYPSGNWENTYYDAAWALGFALDMALASGLNLSKYKTGQPNATSIIVKKLQSLTFEGATGPVKLGGSGRALTTIVYSQLQEDQDLSLTETRIAYYNKNELHILEQNYPPFTRVRDTFPEKYVQVHFGLSIVIIILTLSVVILTALLQMAFIIWRNEKSIKATSPSISHLIFSGCYLFSLATILYAIQQSLTLDSAKTELVYSVLCNAITWCLLLGYSLIFGTVLVKIWRVYKLFKHFRNKSPGLYLTDNTLILAVTSLILVDMVICVTWNILDPWILSKTVTDDKELIIYFTSSCKCEDVNIYYWIGCILVYKGIIGLLLLVFSILNRKIRRENFSHTKKVNVLVYVITMLNGAGFPLYFLLMGTDVHVPFLVLCTVLMTTVVSCCLLIFLPPVLPLLRNNEKTKKKCQRTAIQTTSIE